MAQSNRQNEDGFEFNLLPAKSGAAKSLVIIMHGHGSKPENWQAAAEQLHEQLPDADIINLQGPIKTKDGFTWMPYQGPILQQAKHSLSMVFRHLPIVDKLNSFIDAQLAKRGMDERNLGILGSSMGGITALQAAFNRTKPVAAVVSHSGALLPFTKIKSKPDILLIMGGKDEVFCQPKRKGIMCAFNAVTKPLRLQHRDTIRRLRKARVSFTEKFYPQLKHEHTKESVREAGLFLNNALNRKHKAK